MPREKINYPVPFVPRDPGADDSTPPIHGEAWTEPVMHVSWSKATGDFDGHVQIALEVDPAYLKYVAENPGDNTLGCTAVFTGVLVRADLNRLIRVSRQARDQAYGRDE